MVHAGGKYEYLPQKVPKNGHNQPDNLVQISRFRTTSRPRPGMQFNAQPVQPVQPVPAPALPRPASTRKFSRRVPGSVPANKKRPVWLGFGTWPNRSAQESSGSFGIDVARPVSGHSPACNFGNGTDQIDLVFFDAMQPAGRVSPSPGSRRSQLTVRIPARGRTGTMDRAWENKMSFRFSRSPDSGFPGWRGLNRLSGECPSHHFGEITLLRGLL